MHLDAYLKEAGISQGGFGQRLNPPVSQGLVSQWVRGTTRITLDYALQIARETKHSVTPQDCADMYTDHPTVDAGREFARRKDDKHQRRTN